MICNINGINTCKMCNCRGMIWKWFASYPLGELIWVKLFNQKKKKKFGPCSAPYGTSRAPKTFFFIIYSTKKPFAPVNLLEGLRNF